MFRIAPAATRFSRRSSLVGSLPSLWSLSRLAVWLLLALSARSVVGQVRLTARFDESTTSRYETGTTTRQTITLGSRTSENSFSQTMELEIATDRRDAGRLTVNYRPTRLQVESVRDGERFSFDSSRPIEPALAEGDSPAAASNRLFAAFAESPWRIVVDDDLQVLEFLGRDELLDRLDPAVAESLRPQFEPEYLKRQAEVELRPFPDRALRVGDRWRRERDLILEAGMRLKLTEECRYLGVRSIAGSDRHRVELKCVEASLEAEDSAQGEAADDAPKLEYGPLRVSESRGELTFDERRGVIESLERRIELSGPLSVSIGPRTIDGRIELILEERQQRRE